MKTAVLGFGTVGAGIYEMLSQARGLEQGPVLVRPGKDDAPFKKTSIEAVLSEPGVEAVAEAMGGIEPAFSYAMAAIKAGKHFVTSWAFFSALPAAGEYPSSITSALPWRATI